MGKQFDDLSRAMAGKVSRAGALRAMVGGACAAVLAVILPEKTFAERDDSNKCTDFCNYVYGPTTSGARSCIAQAARRSGPCYYYGPSSPACENRWCPPGSFCTSVSVNYGYHETYCQHYT